MATPTITKIQVRRDTSASWSTSIDPLLAGEPAFDTTNNTLKIGPTGGALWTAIGPTGTFYPGLNSDGATGYTGYTGSGGTGPTGPTGYTGPTGSFSFTGPVGSILFFNGTGITGSAELTYGATGLGISDAILRWSYGNLGPTGFQVSADNGTNWGVFYDTIYNPLPGAVVYSDEYVASSGPITISSLTGVTTDTVYITAKLVGGGGGGGPGGSSIDTGGGGGGGAGYVTDIESIPISSDSTITITVGAGGAGGAEVYNNGGDGSATQLHVVTPDNNTYLWLSNGGKGGRFGLGGNDGAGDGGNGQYGGGGGGYTNSGGGGTSVVGNNGQNGQPTNPFSGGNGAFGTLNGGIGGIGGTVDFGLGITSYGGGGGGGGPYGGAGGAAGAAGGNGQYSSGGGGGSGAAVAGGGYPVGFGGLGGAGGNGGNGSVILFIRSA